MSTKLFRLRPVLKNEQELEEERNLYFELPRKNCAQISPAIKKLTLNPNKSEVHRRWYVLKKILKRARVKGADKKVLQYLNDLDRSDQIIPHGEVSKKLYMDIFHSRSFNLYGTPVHFAQHPPRKHLELKFLASQLGIEFSEKIDPSYLAVVVEPTEEELIARRKAQIPKITTEKWKIGHSEVYKPPVGFAANPKEPYNSLGNEIYFSYDGLWKAGKMHGRGVFMFEDGLTYEGDMSDNRPHGNGKATYVDGRVYEGDWHNGIFQGRGKYTTEDGLEYVGTIV